jgi:ABC-type bacteriocin/lantibiotic exporter with double-glycine peptidase domain
MPNVFISKPHHKQQLDASCLPACAKMLLNFLGSEIEESILRNLLITDDYGTPALNILMLNASLPDTKAELHIWLLKDLINYLETKQQPCIVTVITTALPYWDEADISHAVVVCGFDEENIFVNDPDFDEEEFIVPIDAFLTAWSEAKNIAITIERR